MDDTLHSTIEGPQDPSPPARLDLGQSIDRYEVEAWIGQGGCANVYKVRHKQLGITRALKLLQPSSPALQKRFINEGRLQAQWQHPNIVRVHDALLVENQPALILDFIDGLPLHHHIQKHRPDFQQLTDLFIGIVKGVSHAHRNGIIHRDLKPSNILVEQQNGQFVARVTDFGIAKHLNPTPTDQPKTRTDAMMGTPHYMAPEQIRHNHPITAQTDIFCLGTILFEMCCGVRPFEQPDSLQLLNAIANVEHPHPHTLQPDIPPILVHIIEGCLQVEPHQRFDSCDTISKQLQSQPETIQPTAALASSSTKTRPMAMPLLGLLILLAGSVALLWYSPSSPATHLALEHRAIKLMHQHPAQSLALMRAASTDLLKEATIINTLQNTGAQARVIELDGQVLFLQANHKGTQLLAMTQNSLYLVDTQTGQHQRLAPKPKAFDHHINARFSPDDKTVTIWPIQRKTNNHIPPVLIESHTGKIIASLPHPDKPEQLYYTKDQQILILSQTHVSTWDQRGKQKRIKQFAHPIEQQCTTWTKTHLLATRYHNNTAELLYINPTTLDIDDIRAMPVAQHTTCRLTHHPTKPHLYHHTQDHLHIFDIGGPTIQTLARRSISIAPSQHLNLNLSGERLLLLDTIKPPMLYDQNLNLVALLTQQHGITKHAIFSPDRQLILTANTDKTIGMYTPQHGRLLQTLHGHKDWALHLAQTHNTLWSGGRDHTLRGWSLNHIPKQRKLATPPRHITQHHWSKDGQHLLVLDDQQRLHGWDAQTHQTLHHITTLTHAPYPPQATPKYIITTHEQSIELYDRSTYLPSPHKLPRRSSHPIVLLDDQTLITTTTQDNQHHTITLDHIDSKTTKTIPVRCTIEHLSPLEHLTNHAMIQCLSGELFVLNASQQVVVQLPGVLLPRASTLAVNPVTRTALMASWSGHTALYTHQTRSIQSGHKHSDAINHIISAHNAPWFITADLDGHIRQIDATTAKPIKTIAKLPANVLDIQLSHDDKSLAILLKNQMVYHINLTQNTPPRTTLLPAPGRELRFDKQHHLSVLDTQYRLWTIPPSKTHAPTGQWTNYRVCKSTGRVIPVVPFPPANTTWAPPQSCKKP